MIVNYSPIELPALVVRIKSHKAFANRQVFSKLYQCTGQIALRLQNATDGAVARAQIALPACVVRIQCHKAFANRERFAILSQRFGEVALPLEDTADN